MRMVAFSLLAWERCQEEETRKVYIGTFESPQNFKLFLWSRSSEEMAWILISYTLTRVIPNFHPSLDGTLEARVLHGRLMEVFSP
jgi:hypothetical protein